MLEVIETGAKLFERTLLVLDLRTLFLALDHEARRDVGQAHCGIGRVHALSAGAGCAEEVQPDVFPLEVHVELARLREHCHRRGRGLDAALSLGLGHALHAVHSGLVLHHSVDSFGI